MLISRKFRHLPVSLGVALAGVVGLRAQSQLNYSNPDNVTLLAGSSYGFSGDSDGTGTSAAFNYPGGVVLDGNGNAYVADTKNDAIRKVVLSSGQVTTFATGFGPIQGIAIDASGNLYVSDWVTASGNGAAIRKISSSGSVSTLASGSFNQPYGLVVDASGNVYVADAGDYVIRKVSSTGTVTTYAGTLGTSGTFDGAVGTGEFVYPVGVAFDTNGNLFVTDEGDDTVRKVTTAGVTSTYAGQAANAGLVDGSLSNASFIHPWGIAIDANNNIFVTDDTTLLREISASGTVSTLAGYAGVTGHVNASGQSAELNDPLGLAVESGDTLVVADTGNSEIRVAAPPVQGQAPQITTQPSGGVLNAGGQFTLQVLAAGAGLTYQWYLGGNALVNGANISGATSATLQLTDIGTTEAGNYTVKVTNSGGSVTSNAATITVQSLSRLVNLSARAYVQGSTDTLNAGFAISSGSKSVLVRGIGPALTAFSVPGALPQPVLTLYDTSASPAVIATNIGWSNSSVTGPSTVQATIDPATASLFSQVGAFGLTAGSADCAMDAILPSGTYTTVVTGSGGSSGVALAELYDADTGTPSSRLVNLSARALVEPGANILIAGFSISGGSSETVLIRGIGPGLTPFGVNGVLTQPVLTLYDTASTPAVIATNIGWGTPPTTGNSTVQASVQPATTAVFNQVYAFGLPTGSADCAMVVTLPPGTYTAQVSGANATSGVALVEVYEVR